MLVMVACVSNLSTQHRKLRQEDYEYLGQSGLQGGSKTNKQASLKYRKRLYLKQHQKKKRKKKGKQNGFTWMEPRERAFVLTRAKPSFNPQQLTKKKVTMWWIAGAINLHVW